ncbi:carbohydrate ABC transporter permease [Paenibacillus allorhizosphaerae]|uniref:Inner membrane ABC transporter permease protein YcjP n=1 Tax=Paenibacillus allorhizosphaerae TaxID=2849866 RepID=A0ABM8VUQ8_9BACL|nr:carbohydrate ABC transporter permease [Paenibacillus allorhizosphaerae]CAG7658968.1 Inner membrane ABC transporter permease protein YcjP [Paenibacillus allorhizosphaerae]
MMGQTSLSNRIFHSMNAILLGFIGLITLFPFLNVIANSLSGSRALASGEVFLWPVDWTFEGFHNLIEDGQLFIGMRNTITITMIGTCLNLIATMLAAYPLSRGRLRGRNALLMGITFTMIFSGGIIPNFILIKSLGLMNSYWALWLPNLISTYNMFVMKSFYEGLPVELEESAVMDGANDFQILGRIIIPLSMPILAALGLFYAVSWWNAYFNVLMYITSSTKLSLMMVLYQKMNNVSETLLTIGGSEGAMDSQNLTPEGIRAAAIVTATAPILMVYPFLQKYFIKGVLIGSVKG